MGLATEAHEWADENGAAATVQATISRAADAGGRHVCKSITASIATGATASGVEQVVLRDGATGAGTILWSCFLSAPVNGTANISVSGLNIIGTKGVAMTLEFVAGGAATSQESVAISGYTCKENFVGV